MSYRLNIKRFISYLFLSVSCLLSFESLAGSFTVIDDNGYAVKFVKTAKRIISLSPHATELLFAAGATDQIAATVNYSDYPPEAKKIPRIGSYKKIDLESIVKINPDLIVGWKGGGSEEQIEDFKRLGYKVYFSEPKSFENVATNIINMGEILGTQKIAKVNADRFLDELLQLKKKYQNLKKVDVFYQVWNKPLMTINNDHLITEVINFCGGHNVFGSLYMRAPRVNIESVIQKNPKAIIIGMSENRKDWIAPWFKWTAIDAVKNRHVYSVNADLIVRQGPRILQGTKMVCEALERVRGSE